MCYMYYVSSICHICKNSKFQSNISKLRSNKTASINLVGYVYPAHRRSSINRHPIPSRVCEQLGYWDIRARVSCDQSYQYCETTTDTPSVSQANTNDSSSYYIGTWYNYMCRNYDKSHYHVLNDILNNILDQ